MEYSGFPSELKGKLSQYLSPLQIKEEDGLKFFEAETHLGGTNLDFQMKQYVYKRKNDNICTINPKIISTP